MLVGEGRLYNYEGHLATSEYGSGLMQFFFRPSSKLSKDSPN